MDWRYHSRMDEQRVQAKRIDRILVGILRPKAFRVTFGYSDEGISFRIDDTGGNILGEAYRGTSVSEIKNMSDEAIEKRLKEILANTQRLLYSAP